MDNANDLIVNKILKERYFLVQDNSWEDVCRRVSQILEDPVKQQKFYEIMVTKKFIPSSPTIMNFDPLGKTCGGLSSCFPLSIGDSIDEIGQALHDCMTVVKYSGGVGYNFSKLRSSKEAVKSLNNSNSSGPLSYERIFSKVLDEIQQGGRRRGAGMAAYDIDHPDILDVIESKKNVKDNRYQRFNHSIRVTEEFYYFLEKNPDAIWNVKFKDGSEHPLTDNEGNKVTVQQLWNKIVDCAWASAEPGILNIDIAVKKNVVTKTPLDISANPCQEFIHVENSSCNLGSFNIFKYLNGNVFNETQFKIDLETVYEFMDKVIDRNKFPTKKIAETTRNVRPIGIGIMGVADYLMSAGIVYGSEQACEIVENIIKLINFECIKHSINRAVDFGKFPLFNKQYFDEQHYETYIKHLPQEIKNKYEKYGIRNSTFTSIAPTGAIALLAGCNGGIEPIFSNYYIRKIEIGKTSNDEIIYREEKFFNEELVKYVSVQLGVCPKDARKKLEENFYVSPLTKNIDFLSDEAKEVFLTANEISVEKHMNMLAAASKYCNLSVSKTINLPNSATREDVEKVYLEARKRNVIGVTIYRDGCRDGILTHVKEEKTKKEVSTRFVEIPGIMKFFKVKGVDFFIALAVQDGRVTEIFTSKNYHTEPGRENEIYIPNKDDMKGKIKRIRSGSYEFLKDSGEKYVLLGKHSDENVAAFSRMCSLFLRNGGDVGDLVEQIDKIKGDLSAYCKVISRTLKTFIPDGSVVKDMKCPVCGADIIRVNGCKECASKCGWNACG